MIRRPPRSPLFPNTTLSRSATGVVKVNVPFPVRVLYLHASIRAKGGTQGVTTLQCFNAGTAVTNAMDLGTPAAGTIRSEEHTLNSSHSQISYAVFCLKKKKK